MCLICVSLSVRRDILGSVRMEFNGLFGLLVGASLSLCSDLSYVQYRIFDEPPLGLDKV